MSPIYGRNFGHLQNYSSTHISNNIVSTTKNSYSNKYNNDTKKFNENVTVNPDAKILLASTLFKGNESKFLVDSGLDLSFIKESKITNKKKTDRSNIIKVCGLSTHNFKTQGTILVSIAETKIADSLSRNPCLNIRKESIFYFCVPANCPEDCSKAPYAEDCSTHIGFTPKVYKVYIVLVGSEDCSKTPDTDDGSRIKVPVTMKQWR